jgi:hypothetical protein
MYPRNIRYTQDSINFRFSDGRTMERTFRQLWSNQITTDDIEPFEVVQNQDRWWALSGNRRLFIYKILEQIGIIRQIAVKILNLNDDVTRRNFLQRFTTRTEGLSVKVRGRPGLERELLNIADEELRDENITNAVRILSRTTVALMQNSNSSLKLISNVNESRLTVALRYVLSPFQ